MFMKPGLQNTFITVILYWNVYYISKQIVFNREKTSACCFCDIAEFHRFTIYLFIS